ncbi:MAG: KilA-N domain-containing protein [Desulfovibrio sp.]|nr:KilA-N domain-containing protein [Desulfovibrio sp.]MBI4958728.1 KilA-N domain-containing protein [Desulfovibrio sp.]
MYSSDLWKMEGSESRNRPKAWLETQQAQDFVAEVSKGQNPALFLNVTLGRNGGTFAHWQIALAYAKTLSAKLHRRVNAVWS